MIAFNISFHQISNSQNSNLVGSYHELVKGKSEKWLLCKLYLIITCYLLLLQATIVVIVVARKLSLKATPEITQSFYRLLQFLASERNNKLHVLERLKNQKCVKNYGHNFLIQGWYSYFVWNHNIKNIYHF